MKYVDEYRDPAAARALIDLVKRRATRRHRVMEVCGGQTHTLIRYGIDRVLEDAVELVHGPGCPVCVTPVGKIDRAVAIARRPNATVVTFGDMLRVPGTGGDLLAAKAAGADVRYVYSPLDAVAIAEANPDREVVFFAVGFETTAPANAMAVRTARDRGVENFSVIVSHVLVPPAIRAILDDPDAGIEGFIAPGHVCAIVGASEYVALAREYGVPFVIAGFEPLDLLQGIEMLVRQLESGEATLENQYTRTVRPDGNPAARAVMDEVFEPAAMTWRGIGTLPGSGLRLREAYRAFDAEVKFDVASTWAEESDRCIAGDVLRGKAKPRECAAFGTDCTPETPLGAPMVSTEGACAAYHAFRRGDA